MIVLIVLLRRCRDVQGGQAGVSYFYAVNLLIVS